MPRMSPPLILASLLASIAPARADRPPNVVLILADDLGWGDVGFNGRKGWATPNLDRLAAQGTTFARWYTAAVVCAPSRAALMTGKYTIHDGVSRNNDDLPASEVTIAEALKARGYATAIFGKWHHGAPRAPSKDYVHPMDQGFDEFLGFTDARHAWEQFPNELWHGRELKPVTGYANDLFTDRAVDFLERKKDAPFFLYLPYIATHFHIQAPEDEVALHRGKFAEADPSNPLNATYAAMVTRLDRNVGRVMTAIDRLGLDRDTVVIFSSDHGATFEQGNKGVSNFHDSNRPFRGQKRTLWEGGIRVPGVVRWPGRVPSGVLSHGIVHNTDILPTLLAAVGGSPDRAWKVDGLDLLPAWTGAAKYPDRTLFWEWRSEGCDQLAAMRGNLKLVITGGTRHELFDVEADPAERRSIAAQYPDDANALEAGLKAWLATERENPGESPGPSRPAPKAKIAR
ncbi:MAG TPA: sulfatase-like hydrolase/transferase [Isosphaeraceae bacterium]